MSKPNTQSLHEFAWEIVLDHAQDIERMSVGEIMADDEMFEGLTEDEFDEVEAIIYDQARAYAKALTKPDGLPQDERDAQLADLATELDAANDNADEIADRASAYREEIMRLRARVRKLEGAQGERDGDVPDPADVPDEWLQAAFDAIGRSGAADGDEQMRNVLAAVLPLYRQRMRNGDIEYAAGLEAGDTKAGG